MCYNGFTIKIDLFKSKRFKDGRCTYKNAGSSDPQLNFKARNTLSLKSREAVRGQH